MSEPVAKKAKVSKQKAAKESKTEAFIVGMGNPLLDISAPVSEDFLKKYELKANDAILAGEKHLPIYADLVKSYEVSYIAGGATQNSIRVAQWLGQTADSTAFLGSVGKDAFGAQLRTCAEADGLKVVYQEDTETPTGTCAVLITGDGAQRSLVTNLQAANNFKLDHLKAPEVEKVWQKGTIYYSAGFFLTVSVPSLLHVAQHALKKNAIFCMNLSAPFIPQFFKDQLATMLPYCDFIFGNEAEAKSYAEAFGLKDSSPKAVVKYLAELPKENKKRSRVAVITQGPDETLVYVDGKLTTHSVPKIKASEIVDSNGAGDAFVGGFLAYLAQGKSIEECIRAGQYAAWEILQVSGTVIPKYKPDFRCFK